MAEQIFLDHRRGRAVCMGSSAIHWAKSDKIGPGAKTRRLPVVELQSKHQQQGR